MKNLFLLFVALTTAFGLLSAFESTTATTVQYSKMPKGGNEINTEVCISGCTAEDGVLKEAGLLITLTESGVFTELPSIGVCLNLATVIPQGTMFKICPVENEDFLNGVSTYDKVLIAKHISGEQPFTSPYQWIAADINRDNIIDSVDIVELEKLILGIYDTLPNNTSWRFVPKNFVFSDPTNPLALPIPSCITADSLINGVKYEFRGVKIGDVNLCIDGGSVSTSEAMSTLQVQPPQPNPTNAGVSIAVSSDTWKPLKVSIIDLTGRVMYENVSESKSGAQVLEIPESAFPSTGMYIWQVSDGDYLVSGKVFRLRN